MLKVLRRTLTLFLFIALAQPALAALASDPGDGTPPMPFDTFRVGMSVSEIEGAGAKKMEDGVWGLEKATWGNYEYDCMLRVEDGAVKQAAFRFDMYIDIYNTLMEEFSSRDLYPIASDAPMKMDTAEIFKMSKEELEDIVAERFIEISEAGEGDVTFFYMPAEVYEAAAAAGGNDEEIGTMISESMLHVLKADMDEESIILVVGLGSNYDD